MVVGAESTPYLEEPEPRREAVVERLIPIGGEALEGHDGPSRQPQSLPGRARLVR